MSSLTEVSSPRPRRLFQRVRPYALAAMAAAALVACGGGSSGGAQGGMGTLALRITDGPDNAAQHVWVTISKVAVSASDTAQNDDSGWTSMTLPSPLTFDLNALSNGSLSDVIASIELPAGAYKQIRLILAGSDEALTDSAVAAGQVYNDQVDYLDDSGTLTKAPLEIAQAKQGISLHGNFMVAEGQSLNLVVEFDAGNDVVPFRSVNYTAFTMVPELKYFDLAASGAVVGKVDTSACDALATNPCANLMAKAEAPSADGSVHAVKRWTSVAADGSFVLYPLPVGTNQTYDLVVRGDNAQTLVVRGVPVTAGSAPNSGATSVSTNPLAVASATSYPVNWAASPQPTGVTGRFYQTLDGAGSLPYEVSTRRLDPFSGRFMDDLMLTGGAVMVGNYVAGGNPVMAPVNAGEGDGAYTAMLDGKDLARTGAGTVTAMADGSTALITPPDMAVAGNVAGFGTLSGTIAQSTPGKYDSGYLVVTRGGLFVNTMDIGAVLQGNGGAGGAYSIGHLPAGSPAMPLGHDGNGSGIYYAYLRVWNSATPETVALVPVAGSADMSTANTATLNVTVQ
ncbi:MAG: DUF4382 domain-containing protein [Burkholderiaceae bacterium]